MLSTENVALREENDNLVTLREEGMLASQGIFHIFQKPICLIKILCNLLMKLLSRIYMYRHQCFSPLDINGHKFSSNDNFKHVQK